MPTAEERLDRLERALARERVFNRWLLAALVLIVFLTMGVSLHGIIRPCGRYAISGERILDTARGQLWVFDSRPGTTWITDCGTIENPKSEHRRVRTPRVIQGAEPMSPVPPEPAWQSAPIIPAAPPTMEGQAMPSATQPKRVRHVRDDGAPATQP